jgi:hypothetical protein
MKMRVTKAMYEIGKTHAMLGLVAILLIFNGLFLAPRNELFGVIVAISGLIPVSIMNYSYLDYYFEYKRGRS